MPPTFRISASQRRSNPPYACIHYHQKKHGSAAPELTSLFRGVQRDTYPSAAGSVRYVHTAVRAPKINARGQTDVPFSSTPSQPNTPAGLKRTLQCKARKAGRKRGMGVAHSLLSCLVLSCLWRKVEGNGTTPKRNRAKALSALFSLVCIPVQMCVGEISYVLKLPIQSCMIVHTQPPKTHKTKRILFSQWLTHPSPVPHIPLPISPSQ